MDSKPFVDVLDQAIARQLAGEPATAVLAEFHDEADQLWPLLDTSAALMAARPVEMPPTADRQTDRAAFLALTAVALPIRPSPNAPAQRVPTRRDRLVGLFAPLATLVYPQRKEHNRMITLAVRAALILALFIGSLGGTAVLANNSLPGSPAYSVKRMFEQSRLALNDDPAAEARLYLGMARARIDEMVALANSGAESPSALSAQLQQQLALAYHHAAQAPDASMQGILTQARTMTQHSAMTVQQTRAQAQGATQAMLQTAATLLQRARQAAQYGLDDPAGFRQYYAAGSPEDAPFGPFGPRDGDCNGECDPAGDQHQHGPQPTPPAGPHGNCDGDCEPTGDQHQHGPQPTPPAGPNGDCDGDCQPAGDQHQHGPQPTPPAGPNGDCDGDCDPAGDQHQHGPQPTPPADPGDGNGSGGQQSDPPSGDNSGSGSGDNGSDDNGSGDNGSGDNGSGDNGSGDNGGMNPPPAGSNGGSDNGGQGSGSDQGGSGSGGSDQGGGGRK